MHPVPLGLLVVLALVIPSPPTSASPLPGGGGGETGGRTAIPRVSDVISLEGRSLPAFLGRSRQGIRLLALRGGRLEPIPFQIDEQDAEGRPVLPGGPQATADPDPSFDANDLLLFMAHDLGDRLSPGAQGSVGALVHEIEVTDPTADGAKGWAYALWDVDPPPPCDRDYVRYNFEEGRTDDVDAQHYSIHYPWGQYYPDTIFIPEESGGTGVDFIDRFKARGTVKLFFSLMSIRVTEDRMETRVAAYTDGPIRVIRRVEYWANLGLGIHSPSFEADIIYYAAHVESPITARIPVRLDLFVSKVFSDIGTDFNRHAYGLVFRNSNNPDGTLVDGRMSPQEQSLDLSQDDWATVAGPQGAFFWGPMTSGERADQVSPTLHYVDDYTRPDPPEAEPGQIGHAFSRTEITHLRPGVYRFDVVFYIPPHFKPGDEQDFVKWLATPLEAVVHPARVTPAAADRSTPRGGSADRTR